MGGEPPCAVDDHPHRQPDLPVDDGGFEFTVAQLHQFTGDRVDPQVGVGGPGGQRSRQRRVGEVLSW
jgi:hypothetical protein